MLPLGTKGNIEEEEEKEDEEVEEEVYESKMYHYSRSLCYFYILLSAGTVEPKTQDEGLSRQVSESQGSKPIQIPCHPELT